MSSVDVEYTLETMAAMRRQEQNAYQMTDYLTSLPTTPLHEPPSMKTAVKLWRSGVMTSLTFAITIAKQLPSRLIAWIGSCRLRTVAKLFSTATNIN